MTTPAGERMSSMQRGSTFGGSWTEAPDVAATCRESAILDGISAHVTHVKGGE